MQRAGIATYSIAAGEDSCLSRGSDRIGWANVRRADQYGCTVDCAAVQSTRASLARTACTAAARTSSRAATSASSRRSQKRRWRHTQQDLHQRARGKHNASWDVAGTRAHSSRIGWKGTPRTTSATAAGVQRRSPRFPLRTSESTDTLAAISARACGGAVRSSVAHTVAHQR